MVDAQEKKKPGKKPKIEVQDPDAEATAALRKKVRSIAGFDPESPLGKYVLDFDAATDVELQKTLQAFDKELRGKYEMTSKDAAVGMLDIRTLRLAMINPDRGEYAASIAKVGILLAYFQLHPEAATNLDVKTRHELGKMAKASDNAMAAVCSQELGLKPIQQVLNAYRLYDPRHGGGIWVGKHYGRSSERYGDPIDDHSHAANVRQLLRYFLFLEQGRLVSPEASKTMREIFATPEVPHTDNKFVKALAGRNVEIIRKWGSWQTYLHDAAVIKGRNRHYILVGLTNHKNGDGYLEDMAIRVDDLMIASAP